ncbi:hypothetical protein Taro_001119 [Colocasia esculenta]|uniref:Aminoacyl-tRNA synthetase class II (D/K/N) domain-containing protein n=1 Tax=Colocasia esculenta TaxID=4460 RepID=A0A843TIA0_COLES|nr:hypothetical protein [Colocasia esculenta]
MAAALRGLLGKPLRSCRSLHHPRPPAVGRPAGCRTCGPRIDTDKAYKSKTRSMAAQPEDGGVAGNEHRQKREREWELGHSSSGVLMSKYSKRVALSTILCASSDGARGLEGQRVVVGGWVKSCKHKEAGAKKQLPPKPPCVPVVSRDVTCSEVLITRLPFLRPLVRLFLPVGGSASGPPAFQKPDSGSDDNEALPAVTCLKINDGSCVRNLQVLIDSSISVNAQVTVGASILVEGVLRLQSTPAKYLMDLVAEKLIHVGLSDPHKYPFAKKQLPLESSRLYPHLRPRTTTVASITRIRNGLSTATNAFFQANGFLHVQMPVITTTSHFGEGPERFQVTTLLKNTNKSKEIGRKNDEALINLDVVRAAIKDKSRRIDELKRSNSNREALAIALEDLKKANELAFQLEMSQTSNSGASLKIEKVDFSKDFFSQPAYLSVSAGLHLESYACALSSVYTFGPVFQAKTSESTKDLAEMWMVEAELAFSELEVCDWFYWMLDTCFYATQNSNLDVMNCTEDYLKFLCQWILENCLDDLRFSSKRIDKSCINRLQCVATSTFKRITYREAVDALKTVTHKTFKTQIKWGIHMSEEHENYLVDEIYKCPIIVYDYPKELRPFYVHLKDDGKTVSAFDVIVPKVGVLVRGSQKEERIDAISARIDELGLPRQHYEWYLELRRHGTIKHSSFSLGFENMVMFATGIGDARDVIPFPRFSGNAVA